MKTATRLILAIAFSLCLIDLCQGQTSQAFGFVSTKNTKGDKCVACVSTKNFYCRVDSSSPMDCYGDEGSCNPNDTHSANSINGVSTYLTTVWDCPYAQAASQTDC